MTVTPQTDSGTIVAVATTTLGDELAAPPTTGGGTQAYGEGAYGEGFFGGTWHLLQVKDCADFADDGGWLQIGDETVYYTSAEDDDANDVGILVLEGPLAGTYAEGERATLSPPAFTKTAQVMVGDFSEAVEVDVPHELWDKIPDGIRADGEGEVVTFDWADGEFTLTGVHGQQPDVDGGFIGQETTHPEAFMDGSLYGMVGFVDGGFVAGDLLGANVQFSAAGITADNTAGERTFQVDALTGNVTTVGLFASSLTPNEAHVVIGDLAGSGTTRSFMYFYTGEELDTAGVPVTGYAPGEVSSGIDTDTARYIRLRSPDNPTVNQGELTIRSSLDAATRPVLGWSGDIRLRGDQGVVYALNASNAKAPLTIDGSALVLSVPNGTMRLGEATSTGANRLRSRNSDDTVVRKLELEADDILLDVSGGSATMRVGTTGRFQIANFSADVGILFLDSAGLRVSNWAGGGHRPIAASSFDVNSDATVKNGLTDVDPAVALQQVRGVKVYDYTRKDDGRRQRGLMAQDVAQAVPIAAVEYSDENTMGVDLYGLTTTAVAATQALAARLEAVEAKTANLPSPPRKAP